MNMHQQFMHSYNSKFVFNKLYRHFKVLKLTKKSREIAAGNAKLLTHIHTRTDSEQQQTSNNNKRTTIKHNENAPTTSKAMSNEI